MATRTSSNRWTRRTGELAGMVPRITATSIDACSTAASGSSERTSDTVAPVACSNWPTACCAHGSGSSQLKPSRIVTWLRTDARATSRSASTRSA